MFRSLRFLSVLFCSLFLMGAAAYADAEFTVTTTADTTSFSFEISAAGEFTVDWGDGNIETITKTNIKDTTYSHTYSTAGAYNIGISGQATAYDTSILTAAISFQNNQNVAGISGSLGAIFGTLADGTNPRFYQTLSTCFSLASNIPENLFDGISGAPVRSMFHMTFYNSTAITGSIPENLFSGIKGQPAEKMFADTFENCNKLTGTIPENLFSGIEGAPAAFMFSATFMYCNGLTGNIPENLFSGIKGQPAKSMFSDTFFGTAITSIPENLFSGIKGQPAEAMFSGTFANPAITSIPENLFSGIKGTPAPEMFSGTFANTAITSIPENLFSGIKGQPEQTMFYGTFFGTAITSIPPKLFSNISGMPAPGMFFETFANCTNLTGYVDGNMFTISAAGSETMYPYLDTFAGNDNMDTVCPENTYTVDKPDSSWTVAVCNPCPDGATSPANSSDISACTCGAGTITNSIGGCSAPCASGITKLQTSTGISIPLFATKNTSPAIFVSNRSDAVCYADLTAGTATGALHVQHNGTTYHTTQ